MSGPQPCFGFIEKFSGTNAEDWELWTEILDQYFLSNDIGTDAAEKKRAIFLSSVGTETYKLIRNLLAPAKVETKSYVELCKIVKDHFNPKPSIIVARFKFHTRCRQEQENIAEYIAALRDLSQYCNFSAEVVDEMLRDRFVCGVNDDRIQRRLLGESDSMDFKKACGLAQAIEAAEKNAATLQNHVPSSVNRVKQEASTGGKPGKCHGCGKWHFRRDCPHHNTICYLCGTKGHIASVCPSKRQGQGSVKSRPFQRKQGKGYRQTHVVENCTAGEEEDDAEEKDCYTMFYVAGSSVNMAQSQDREEPMYVTMQVQGLPLQMEIDTGAVVAMIGKQEYERNFSHLPLHESKRRLKTWPGQRISVLGDIIVDVMYEGQKEKLPLLVAGDNGPTLLGRNWLRRIKLDWHNICTVKNSELDGLFSSYSGLFKEGLGKFNGPPVQIHVTSEAQPKFCKARPVPYALREKIDKAIEDNVAQGVWEPIQYSEWASPLVPILKSSGSIRLCGDYKVTVNKFCEGDSYPIPKIDDLYADLAGGTLFTKIDLSQAYSQIPVDEKSQKYLTVNTHRGLFKVNRLAMGIHSAPGIFQRLLSSLLQDLPHVTVYLDDILLTGVDEKQHLQNLEEVFKRLSEAGFCIQKDKCTFMAHSVVYLGHRIDKEGLHPLEDKVRAIKDAPAPKNISELRSFLGLINHYARFLPQLSAVLAPLHVLLRKGVEWHWKSPQASAFQAAKDLLRSDSVLVHYDGKLPLLLECDASPLGVGAVLSHQYEDGSERPIYFASRSLSPAEKHYSQLEREALALVFGVKKYHQYLYGREFQLVTDHKPLTSLFNEDKSIPQMASSRIIRWAVTLSAYQYKIRHKKGTLNSNADALSRLPLPTNTESTPVPADIVLLMNYIDASPVTGTDIKTWTRRDSTLSRVYDWIQLGWPNKSPGEEFRPYFARKDELSTHNGCILWGSRVVVPKPGQDSVLQELHESHIGMSRMKALARSYAWWPNMDVAIEKTVKACPICQLHQNQPAPAELHPWEWPKAPWSRLHIDHAGPFLGKLFLIVIDAHSKWLEVTPVSSTASEVTINALQTIFATHGLPDTIVSDNGSSFTSQEFKQFCKSNGIEHIRVAPYKAASNGLAERAVQIFKSAMKKLDPKVSLSKRLNSFLFKYRITPQTSTGMSPAELRWNCRLKSHLDLLKTSVAEKVQKQQSKQKDYHDQKAVSRKLCEGDPVYIYPGTNSRDPNWKQGTVVEQTGPVSYKVKLSSGDIIKRHLDHIRPRSCGRPEEGMVPVEEKSADDFDDSILCPDVPCVTPQPEVEEQDNKAETPEANASKASTSEKASDSVPPQITPVLRRSQRKVQPPDRLGVV